MKRRNARWTIGVLLAAAVSFTMSQSAQAGGGKSLGKASGVVPATVEHIDGSDVSRVTLTERAMERVDVQTTKVQMAMNESARTVVPYSSIIYDPHGGTWVYTSSEERTFVRHKIVVDDIEGDKVYLTDGPPAGTVVVSVGVAEIYGAEFQVGH